MMVWDYTQSKSKMDSILYSLSLIFIWVEFYQFGRQNTLFRNYDFSKFELEIFLFSLFKFINFIVLPLGLLTELWLYYCLIIVSEAIKMILLYTKSSKIINLYNLFSTFAYLILYTMIFIQGVVL